MQLKTRSTILHRVQALRENSAEQNHWSERGRATAAGNSDALGRPRRSVLACAPGMARYFVGASPMARFRRAEGKEKGKGVVARRGLKEAQSEAAGR
jgi:hypothetical protein